MSSKHFQNVGNKKTINFKFYWFTNFFWGLTLVMNIQGLTQ